ncbi:hypothetical protein [Bacillus sp. OTU530]
MCGTGIGMCVAANNQRSYDIILSLIDS